MIFVDTSAWYGAFVSTSAQYDGASGWLNQNEVRLDTSDYVLDELMTLLKVRGQYRLALEIGEDLWSGRTADVEKVRGDDIQEAWLVYRAFQDKGWSFTDCTSRVVMQRLGISTAFAFDDHFRQFGSIVVVP
jgi:uncharacterized protein